MATKDKRHKLYPECDHIVKIKPDHHANEETIKEIGSNYRTLPTFEKGLFEQVHKNHYSLNRNDLLKCRWAAYKKNIESRVFAPFQFPDVRDLHFHNCAIQFLPAESIHRFQEYRMKLKPGPGVDFGGQMPIPQELLMKRGGRVEKKHEKKKIHRKS